MAARDPLSETQIRTLHALALQAGAGGAADDAALLRDLDPRQRKALALFRGNTTIVSRDVAALFGISERAARNLLQAWVAGGFVVVADPARKTRRYRLGDGYRMLIRLDQS